MTGPWLAAAFDENDPKLFLWGSADGLAWEPLCGGNPVYTPPVGTVRDPTIAKVGDAYYIAHTIGGFQTERSFAVACSVNLKNWVHLIDVDCSGIPDITHVWAPQFFRDDDGSIRIYLTCSTGGSVNNFKVYETHPERDDLTEWSRPLEVTGDFPPNVIDVYMVKVAGKYYLWYKNEDTKVAEFAVSDNPLSGFKTARTGNWAGWGDYVEGYCILEVTPRVWRIYMDKYVRGGMWYSESTDGWKTWTPRQLITTGDKIISHPDIVAVHDLGYLRDLAAL